VPYGAPMASVPLSTWQRLVRRIDTWAIALSGLCLVHCVASAVLIALLSTAGGLLDPRIHEAGLVLAILFGVVALANGVRAHGRVLPLLIAAAGVTLMGVAIAMKHEGGREALVTILGVILLASGHWMNRRALAGAYHHH
jgi:hypothetical protein